MSVEQGVATMDAEVSKSRSVGVLEQQQLEHRRRREYDEAEVAKSQLENLRDQEGMKLCEDLRVQHMAMLEGLEDAHVKEVAAFNNDWDYKGQLYEEHALTLRRQLQDRQQRELDAYHAKVNKEVEPRRPRWSKELLNLRRIEEQCAKQKRYTEGAKVKVQADQREAQETASWKAKRDAKIAGLEDKFVQRQTLEVEGLLKRIQSGRDEQRQARERELERLVRHYRNVKVQVETNQKIVARRVEKNPLVHSPAIALAASAGALPQSPRPSLRTTLPSTRTTSSTPCPAGATPRGRPSTLDGKRSEKEGLTRSASFKHSVKEGLSGRSARSATSRCGGA